MVVLTRCWSLIEAQPGARVRIRYLPSDAHALPCPFAEPTVINRRLHVTSFWSPSGPRHRLACMSGQRSASQACFTALKRSSG